MKRIISLIMAVLMLSAYGVSASGYENTDAYFEITALGIMQGDQNGDLHLEDPLTRAEFAAVITRLMGYDSAIGMGGFTTFADVSENDWFSGYVGLMYGMGIMNGVSETKFSPYTYVTYEQAMKTLVCTLGYETTAERNGGYPDGYLKIGTKLRLNEDVDSFSEFTRGDVMQMLYNSLDVRPLTYQDQEEEPTFREIHAGGTNGVYFGKGVVSANFETYLNAPNSDLENDEVEIDDKVYKIGSTDANLYLGQMVEFYAVQDENGLGDRLVSVKPHKSNTITEILWNDVENTSLSEITYRVDGKKEEADISGAKIVKNGRIIMAPTGADISATRGTVRLVSYDYDKSIEVVFIEDYKNVRVKNVNDDVIEFAEGFTYNGARFLTVDFEDEDVCYTILDSEGKNISTAEIEEDDILSISSDPDGEVYRIVVSKESVTGTINELGEDMILIDVTECNIFEGDVFDTKPGRNVTAYIDYNGFVADIEETEEENNYAYVVESGIYSRKLEFRMIMGSKVVFEYEENTDNPDSTDLIPVVKCANESVEILTAAEKLKVDGIKVDKNDDIYPGLYSYKLNSDGEVKELNSVVLAGGGRGMQYNTYDKTFYLDSKTPVGIDEETIVVCLPKQDIASGEDDDEFAARLAATDDEDYMVPLEISNKANAVSFEVLGYDLDADTKKVNVVVFYETMKADNIVQVNTNSSPIGMVSDIRWTLNEDDEFVQEISLITNKEKKSYMAADIVPGKNDALGNLKEGDLIYYEIGLSGKLDDAEVIYSFSEGTTSFSKNSGTSNYQVCGYVSDVLYDEIEPTSGNLSTIMSVETPAGTVPVTVYQRNIPEMFVYDSESGELRTAELSDLAPGRDENFFALIPLGGKAKACVIYR